MFLLDTNHCSRIIQGEQSVLSKLHYYSDVLVATSVIVAGELRFMARKSARKSDNSIIIRNFLDTLEVYPIDEETAEIYGDFKARLYEHFGPKEKRKREQTHMHKLGFSENDLWIAALARRHYLTIVSSDSDFKRMQNALEISYESWYKPGY